MPAKSYPAFNRSFIVSVNAPSIDRLQVVAVIFVACRQEFLIGVLGCARYCRAFLSDQSGATSIEYALVAMGISIVIVAAVNGIGTRLNGTFTEVSTSIK
jgi:pilus assembly protein Flp/PilA